MEPDNQATELLTENQVFPGDLGLVTWRIGTGDTEKRGTVMPSIQKLPLGNRKQHFFFFFSFAEWVDEGVREEEGRSPPPLVPFQAVSLNNPADGFPCSQIPFPVPFLFSKGNKEGRRGSAVMFIFPAQNFQWLESPRAGEGWA